MIWRNFTLIVIIFTFSALPLYAQGEIEDSEVEAPTGTTSGKAGIDAIFKPKTKVRQAKPELTEEYVDGPESDFSLGNFRVTTTYSRAHEFASGLDLVYWRFIVDYQLWQYFSVFAKVQVPLTSISLSTYRTNTFGGGINWHVFRYGSLGLLLGASVGYTAVEHQLLADQSTVTPSVVASLIYDFTLFHLAFEYSGQITKVTGVDLSQSLWHIGAGFRINI